MAHTDYIPTLSPDELRESRGLSHLTDEEAEKVIESLKALSVITWLWYREMKAKQSLPDFKKTG